MIDDRTQEIQDSMITTAVTLSQSLSTSFGPRGSDKMIIKDKKTIITNDGATILKTLVHTHPINHILSNLSQTQDERCGDGTTSVVVLTGSILRKCYDLLKLNIHPARIIKCLNKIKEISDEYLNEVKLDLNDPKVNLKVRYIKLKEIKDEPALVMEVESIDARKEIPVQSTIESTEIKENVTVSSSNITPLINDRFPNRDSLVKAVVTSLSSKLIYLHSKDYAHICVNAMYSVMGNRKEIKLVKKLGESIDDITLRKSIVLDNKIKNSELKKGDSFEKVVKAAILQFCISAPKTNMDSKIKITQHEQMEKIIKEEREYIYNICKKIKDKGIGLIVVQKSIMRESISDLALLILTRMGILVIDDINREEIDYLSTKLNISCSVDPNFLYEAEVKIIENNVNDCLITEIECKNVCSIILRGGDFVFIDEAERSINDALCVIECLFKDPYLVGGGGSVEMGIADKIRSYAMNLEVHEELNDVVDKINKVYVYEDVNINKKMDVKKSVIMAHGIGHQENIIDNTLKKQLPKITIINEKDYSESSILLEISRAFEDIAYYLAKNAGLDAIFMVKDMEKKIVEDPYVGINVRTGMVSSMLDEGVVQPVSVSRSIVELAVDTAGLIMKIDDVLPKK